MKIKHNNLFMVIEFKNKKEKENFIRMFREQYNFESDFFQTSNEEYENKEFING